MRKYIHRKYRFLLLSSVIFMSIAGGGVLKKIISFSLVGYLLFHSNAPILTDVAVAATPRTAVIAQASGNSKNQCSIKNIARSYGDPHIMTFDGLKYSFQTAGEFILAKSAKGNKELDRDFEIQVRQSPANPSFSLNSAVAMRVGKDRVALYSKDYPDSDTSTPLRVNGQPVKIEGKSVSLDSGGIVYRNNNNYIIQYPTCEQVGIRIYSRGQFEYMDLSVYLPSARKKGIIGLLGNFNGRSKDDLRFRNGKLLVSKSSYGNVNKLVNRYTPVRLPLNSAAKVYLKQLNKDFGNSWRIAQEESLFDYPAGKNTISFTDKSFPDQYLNLGMLSTKELQSARNKCQKAGVNENMMEGCVFDVAFSGYGGFARNAAKVAQFMDVLEDLGISNPIKKAVPNPVRDVIKKVPGIKLPF